MRQAAIAADHACYTYTATLGEKNKAKAGEPGLRRVSVSVPSGMGDASKALEQGASIAAGVLIRPFGPRQRSSASKPVSERVARSSFG